MILTAVLVVILIVDFVTDVVLEVVGQREDRAEAGHTVDRLQTSAGVINQRHHHQTRQY